MGLGKTYSTKYLADSNNNTGVAGQVLISTATGINWSDGTDIIGGPYLPLSAGSSYPLTGELHVDNRVIIENTTNVTTGVADSLLIKTLSSGTSITNGFGGGLSFYLENTVYSAVNEVGKIAVIETDTIAIDDKMVFSVKDNNILAERLTLTGSEAVFTGNVGIGITGPTSKLHSVVTTAGDSALKLQDDTGSVFDFQCGIAGITGDALVIKDTSLSYDYLTLRSGNVGIGTTTPNSKLEVNQNSTGTTYLKVFNQNAGVSATARMAAVAESAQLDIVATSAGYSGVSGWSDSGIISTDSGASGGLILNSQAGGLKFQTSTSEKMRITPTGDVGIGTTIPNSKLTVWDVGQTYDPRTSGINVHRPNSYGQYGSIAYNGGEMQISSTYTGNAAANWGSIKFQQFNNGTVARTTMVLGDTGAISFDQYAGTAFTGTPTYILGTDASGNVVKVLGGDIPGSGDITGAGSANYVTKFTGNKTIGNGPIYFNSNDIELIQPGVFNNSLAILYNGTASGGTGTTAVQYIKIFDKSGNGGQQYLHFELLSFNNSEYSAEVRITVPSYSGFSSSYGTMDDGQGVQIEIIYGGLAVQTSSIVSIIECADLTSTTANTDLYLKIQPAAANTQIKVKDYGDCTTRVLTNQTWSTTAPSNQTREFTFNVGATNINQVLSVHRDQKVGIGTDDPDTKLHVKNESAGDAMLTIQATSAGDPGITMVSINDRTGNIFYRDGAASSTFRKFTYDHADQAFKMCAHNQTSTDFYVSETQAYFAGQNVGINTTNPLAKLEIDNPGQGEFQGGNSSAAGNSHLMLKDEGSTSRTLMSGPSVTFQTPAAADGTNVWATSRLLGSPAAAGSARGTFSIQVRDQYDPFNDGTSWNWRTCLTAINTGNIGIGTNSPSFQLSIENHATTTSVATMEIDGKRTDGNDGAVGELIFSNNGDTFATVAGVRDGADNKGSLQFQTQGVLGFATRMTIATEGEIILNQYTLTQQTANSVYLLGVDSSGKVVQSTNIPSGTGGSAGPYLPLAGGTLTGALTGTSATFSGEVLANGGLKVVGPGSYNTFKSGNDYTLGFLDSAGTTQWWIKAYTNGDFALHENGVGDQFTIEAGGNVGIGVTGPTAKLTLADHTTAAGGIKFRSAATTVSLWSSGSGNLNTNGTFNAGGRVKVPGGNAVADPDFGFSAATAGTGFSRAGQDITFVTGGAEQMRLDNDGNLGIGITTNTTIPLHVNQTGSGTVIKAQGIGATIEIQSGTAGNATLYQRPNLTGDKEAEFRCTLGSTYGWSWKDDNATAASRVKFMKLDQNPGTLTVKGDVVAYGSPSDRRLKENIKPIESALDKVMKLQGVTFDWKQKEDVILDIKEDIGFIAQDVQKVVPELIRKNSNGLLSMRHQGMAPILLEAIKELKAEIDLLKSKSCNCK